MGQVVLLHEGVATALVSTDCKHDVLILESAEIYSLIKLKIRVDQMLLCLRKFSFVTSICPTLRGGLQREESNAARGKEAFTDTDHEFNLTCLRDILENPRYRFRDKGGKVVETTGICKNGRDTGTGY
tara:strand:+ start:65 stop:448 length:384 start_codon:yes stop_codon:yes gene_type:complete